MNELTILAALTTFTGLMWIPYVLDRISRQGLPTTVGYPDAPLQSPWGRRRLRRPDDPCGGRHYSMKCRPDKDCNRGRFFFIMPPPSRGPMAQLA